MRSDDNLQRRFAKEDIDARVYGNMPGVLDTNTKVNGKKVTTAKKFIAAVKDVGSGGLVRMMIQRGKSKLFIAVKKA